MHWPNLSIVFERNAQLDRFVWNVSLMPMGALECFLFATYLQKVQANLDLNKTESLLLFSLFRNGLSV